MSKRRRSSAANLVEGFGLQIFSNDAMDRIHHATLEVLWHEGIQTNCALAKEIYAAGGCVVDDQRDRVYFPAHVVESAIKSAPSSVLMGARDPEHNFMMEGSRVHFCNFSKGVNVNDLTTGEQRDSTLQDQADIAKLVDCLDQYDLLDVGVEVRDVPEALANLVSYDVMVNNCTKHTSQSAHGKREAEYFVEMAKAVAGGSEELRRRPVASTVVCPNSPLSLTRETTEPIIVYAENGLPCTVLSMAMAGGTSPVTLAGTLVTHNAEVLSGIVLAQLTKKGAPSFYGSSTTIMNLRTAQASIGCPELGMLSASISQLAKYYLLPCYVAGG